MIGLKATNDKGEIQIEIIDCWMSTPHKALTYYLAVDYRDGSLWLVLVSICNGTTTMSPSFDQRLIRYAQ